MARGTRLIVFNADEGYAPELRSKLLGIEGVKIVAEVDEPGLLRAAVNQFACDVVLVHLDPEPDVLLHVASQIIRDRPDLPVFAVSGSQDGQMILAAFRGGFREFLVKPLDVDQLTDGFDRVAQQRTVAPKAGKLVTVIGSVGGVGATTVATNLAVELAGIISGQVALVDLDFRFGQVATLLDVQPSFTIADLCDTPEQCDQQMIEKAIVKHPTGVHVLARPNHFAQAEQISAAHCSGVLGALQELYEYVVVDGPNRYDVGGKAVLDIADVNLLVVQLVVSSIRNTDRILGELVRAGYNLSRIKLVCNRIGRETGQLTLDHVEATLGQSVFHTIVDDWRTVSDSINMGEPLSTHAGKSKVRQCVRELAEKIHSPVPPAEPSASAKKTAGLFGKIFSD